MKRDKQAAQANEAAGANATSNQAEASSAGGGSSSSSSTTGISSIDESSRSQVGRHLTKSFTLIDQLCPSTNSENQEQLLLADQGSRQDRRQVPTALKTSFTSRFFVNKSPAMVREKKSPDNVDGDRKLIQDSAKATGNKMSRNIKNTNKDADGHRQPKTAGGDDIESQSKLNVQPKRSCSKWTCFLAVMTLIAVAFILVAYLTVLPIQKTDDKNPRGCPSQSQSTEQTPNKLFATKTLYTTTLSYLSQSQLYRAGDSPFALSYTDPKSQSSLTGNHIPSSGLTYPKYDQSSIARPNIFATTDTLESLHKELLAHGCQLKKFYFYGRHAARLPSSKRLTEINNTIASIQALMNVPEHRTRTNPSADNGSTEQEFVIPSAGPPSSTTWAQLAESNNKPEIACEDPLLKFKQWKIFAEPELGNMVMPSGAQETKALAQRLKDLFPAMFDGLTANISFGNSDELRTAQTAINFLKLTVNYPIPKSNCELSDFPLENTSDKVEGLRILNNKCLTDFKNNQKKEQLYLHDTCEKQVKATKKQHYNLDLDNAKRTQFIVDSVTKSLGLTSNNHGLTTQEVKDLYDICRYESALHGNTSIWCSHFEEKHLNFYEFLSDIDDYFNSAYGDPNLAKSACPITNDLYDSFMNQLEEHGTTPEARFYFTHSEVIQRLIAASVDLSQDAAYSPQNIRDHLDKGTVSKDRQWQTSLFTPFSANIAFNLYHCPEKPGNTDWKGFRVVASLNEQPIRLQGCDGYKCSWGQFSKARMFKTRECDLSTICETKTKFL